MKKIKALVAAVAVLALGTCLLAGCGSKTDEAAYTILDNIQAEHYAVAFELGNEDMATLVGQTLAQLDEDGVVKEICDKYADQGLNYNDWCLEAPEGEVDAAQFEGTKLIVGFDAEYPPYGYMDESGNYVGFDLDLAAAVCEKLGWTFEAKPIDWDSKDALLKSGQITCIWNGFTAEGRETQYALSANYMVNGQVVVVKSDSGIASLDDLAGKNVTTQSGSAAFELLQGDQAELAATFANLDAVPDYNTAFMSLDSGATDCVICDLSVANYYIAVGSAQ